MSYTLLVIAVVLGLMWFLVVRPQRRKQAETIAMQEAVEVGDEIVTAGGLYGEVQGFAGEDVVVEIAPGTNVRVARRAIVGRVDGARNEAEPDEEEAAAVPPNSGGAS